MPQPHLQSSGLRRWAFVHPVQVADQQATHGYSGVKPRVLGSVADRVLLPRGRHTCWCSPPEEQV
jgi:hypothetical protein